MNHQAFISHAEEDRGTAERIQAALEQAGVRCWIAYRDLPPGVTWTEKIIEAISGSRVMVLLVSRAANASQYVIREVGAAVDGQVPIITVLIEAVEPSRGLKFLIGSTQWLDAAGLAPADLAERVLQGVQRLLGSPEKPDPQPPPLPPPPLPWLNRTRLTAALLTVLAVSSLAAMSVKAGWWPGSDTGALAIVPASAQRTVGDAFRLQATLGGQVKPVRWRSSDNAVVSIAPGDSLFRAVAAGTARLHAEFRGRRDSVSVTVVSPAVVAFLRILSLDTIRVGESITLNVRAEDQAQREVSAAKPRWSSLTPAIVRVDAEQGVATGARAGRARVRAQIGEVSDIASFVVAPATPRHPPPNGPGRDSTRRDPPPRDSLPRDTTTPDIPTRNTVPGENRLRELADECIKALQVKNLTWLKAHYNAATGNDNENLKKLEQLMGSQDYRFEGHEVHEPGPQAKAIDFQANFSYRRFIGGKGSANGTFRVSAEADGLRWRTGSCRVVNNLIVR